MNSRNMHNNNTYYKKILWIINILLQLLLFGVNYLIYIIDNTTTIIHDKFIIPQIQYKHKK